jgi:CRISPR/Cas system-associated exonuclease Cas4 (RecB family)
VTRTLHRAPAAHLRIARASEWLASRAPGEEVLVVAASADAANDCLRAAAAERGAAFGWHRATLGRLAAQLALPALVEEGVAPVGALACEAVVARVLHALREAGGEAALGRYRGVADGPGFARAVARTLAELRAAELDPATLAKHAPELAAIAEAFDAELARAGVCDRARVLRLAARAARDPDRAHPLLGLPTLLLDVPVENAAERALVAAVAARASEVVATVPAGDERSRAHLEAALATPAEEIAPGASPDGSSLVRLQAHLFEELAPAEAPLGDDVVVLSTPGESRECVEIARRIRAAAGEGVPFDAIAVLLRSPEEYRPHLEEAFARAGIPAHFARGARRPDPAGRAFVALLACAAEGLSARRFAEYLSLGEVPDATPGGGPPPAPAPPDRWVAPDEELVPSAVAEALGAAREEPTQDGDGPEDPGQAPVVAGTLRAPRRWERLLVDAAVIGGRERWERRLDGLARELALDQGELEDPEGAKALAIRRDLEDLAHLRAHALPLLDALAALPGPAAWGEWLDALSALATRALRHPDRVLAVLSELVPMARVGPVDLEEVALVLGRRLLDVAVPPAASRHGRVFVAPADAARGLSFELVLVPGLAEKLFPRRIAEEPILLDPVRRALGAELATNAERIDRERLALRLAVGAARGRVVLSYPRLDLDQSRPRVPSFYALEALRAAEGRLPGFDELGRRAERTSDARVGWPAPARSEDALDEAEHDLALLDSLLRLDPGKSVGTARYLLTANPHLGRALRFRARRWLRRWTPADGLVDPSPAAREALREHALAARSYSATALQHFAECPYRFFLAAVHRLAPREEVEAIEEIPPLARGSLVHEVQFELFQRLRDAKLLPVTAQNLEPARELLDAVLARVAERWRDELAPAIGRVWDDGVASVRADLREWLRRTSEDASGFVPFAFELAFGLEQRRARDARSTPDPVLLDCGIRLRGSIDLVERAVERGGTGRVRVTDHKTGKERVKPGAVLDGGRALQPVLYALAAEKLLPEASVESGRLYYCTAAGGFEEREVPLDAAAREGAAALAEVIGGALDAAFLPAAPAAGACRWCDYREVCGPYEELRTDERHKPADRLAPLAKLRGLR